MMKQKHGMDFAQDLKLGQYMVDNRNEPIRKDQLTGLLENSSPNSFLGPDLLYPFGYNDSDWG